MVHQVKLPVLSFDDTEKLAREYFRLQGVPSNSIDRVLVLSAFRVGLADTAGLQGLVGMVCSGGVNPTGSYSQSLQNAVTVYTAKPDIEWSARWPKLATIVLARPPVNEDTKIYENYTVSKARDSGTILFRDNKIGVSSALYRSFNDKNPFINPLLLKHTSNTETWTWQDFEKAHVLYLSAVMGALRIEQSRFRRMTLGNLLRYAEPDGCVHLGREMKLPESFQSLTPKEEEHQSIPKLPKNKPAKRLRHSVDLNTESMVVLACNGTPIIDAHLNLKLGPSNSSTIDSNQNDYQPLPVVLFIQYKHSKLEARTIEKVSAMNAAVTLRG